MAGDSSYWLATNTLPLPCSIYIKYSAYWAIKVAGRLECVEPWRVYSTYEKALAAMAGRRASGQPYEDYVHHPRSSETPEWWSDECNWNLSRATGVSYQQNSSNQRKRRPSWQN
jgi:hypothetical protein